MDIFNQAKTESPNIFSQTKGESPELQQDNINNIFAADNMDTTGIASYQFLNVFLKLFSTVSDSFKPKDLGSTPNIFASVFKSETRNETNVFSQRSKEDNVFNKVCAKLLGINQCLSNGGIIEVFLVVFFNV